MSSSADDFLKVTDSVTCVVPALLGGEISPARDTSHRVSLTARRPVGLHLTAAVTGHKRTCKLS